MTSFALKMIAIITMLIDHIGAVLIPGNTMLNLVFRSIGRLSFPIFVFLIIEGFYHTKNVRKYLARLGIFAVISEISFDLAFYRSMFNADIIEDFKRIFELISQHKREDEISNFVKLVLDRLLYHQNIFFTLFLGLLLITLMNKVEQKFKSETITSYLLEALLIISFSILAYKLNTDYDYAGILLIAAFYKFRGNNILITLSLLVVMGYVLRDKGSGQITISILGTLSMFFIVYYNGKKGKDIKYLFYIFYPAHLFLLFLIDRLR